MLCVDVVAECDRYVGERWERGVCTGKEGGPGGVRGVEGGGVVSPPPSTHAWVVNRVDDKVGAGLPAPLRGVRPRLGPWGRVGGTPLLLLEDVQHAWADEAAWLARLMSMPL